MKSTTLNGRNPTTTSKPINNQTTANGLTKPALTHPAPLPPTPIGPINNSWKPIAPKPSLDIKRVANGESFLKDNFQFYLFLIIQLYFLRNCFVLEHARQFGELCRHSFISIVCLSRRHGTSDSKRQCLEKSR